MCGRYGFGNPARLSTLPFAAPLPVLTERFNIAPSSDVPLVRQTRRGRDARLARWGLVPYWATDVAIGHRLANARGDTMASKPAFRDAFRQRRGLMPADLFYEWQVVPGQKTKQPWCIRLPDAQPFAFGALWERWRAPDAHASESDAPWLISCTIVTTEPNALMKPIHDRMPLIIAPEDYNAWLDPATSPADAQSLVRAYEGPMEAWRVSTHVNRPAFDDAECIAPIDTER